MFRTIFDEEKKLWHGPQIKMKWTEEPSLGAKILKTLKSNGRNVAQVKSNMLQYFGQLFTYELQKKTLQICAVTGDTRTYDDLHRFTVRAAINLQKFGCARGRKICLFAENIANLPPFVFAAICLGCPIVSLVSNASQDECEYFMSIAKPEFAICEPKYHSMFKKCFENLQINAKIFTIDGQADDSISTEHFFDYVDGEDDFE